MPRKPENTKVYDLGHYEQMQIDIAIKTILSSRNSDGSWSLDPMSLDHLDVDVLRELAPIFSAYGTLTILRKEGDDDPEPEPVTRADELRAMGTFECYECAGFDGVNSEPRHATGKTKIVNPADPTESIELTCGHWIV